MAWCATAHQFANAARLCGEGICCFQQVVSNTFSKRARELRRCEPISIWKQPEQLIKTTLWHGAQPRTNSLTPHGCAARGYVVFSKLFPIHSKDETGNYLETTWTTGKNNFMVRCATAHQFANAARLCGEGICCFQQVVSNTFKRWDGELFGNNLNNR